MIPNNSQQQQFRGKKKNEAHLFSTRTDDNSRGNLTFDILTFYHGSSALLLGAMDSFSDEFATDGFPAFLILGRHWHQQPP